MYGVPPLTVEDMKRRGGTIIMPPKKTQWDLNPELKFKIQEMNEKAFL